MDVASKILNEEKATTTFGAENTDVQMKNKETLSTKENVLFIHI